MQESSLHKKTYFLILLGIVVHGLLLIDPSAFWDDFYILNSSKEGVQELYDMAGIYIAPYFFLPHKFFDSVWPFKLTIFLSSVLGSVYLFKTLKNLLIKEETAFFIASIHLSVPIMLARVSNIHAPYIFCYSLSIFGFYYFSKCIFEGMHAKNLIGMVAGLWGSCYIMSILPMNGMIICGIAIYLFFIKDRAFVCARKKTFIVAILTLVIHLVHWLIFCQPSGVFASYNSMDTRNLFRLHLIPEFLRIFTDMGNYLFWHQWHQKICSILIVLIILQQIIKIKKLNWNPKFFVMWITLFVMSFIMTLPYILVDKLPSYRNFESRAHLIYFIPISLFVYSILNFFSSFKSRRIIVGILLFSFTLTWWQFYLSAQHDYHILFSTSRQIKINYSRCRLIDLKFPDDHFRISKRYPQILELSGIFNYQEPIKDYLVSVNYIKDVESWADNFKEAKHIFGVQDIELKLRPDCHFEITNEFIPYIDVIKLSVLSYFSKNTYQRDVATFTKVKYIPSDF